MNHSPLPEFTVGKAPKDLYKWGYDAEVTTKDEGGNVIAILATRSTFAPAIVHAANTLPKVLERNAELVEALQRIVDSGTRLAQRQVSLDLDNVLKHADYCDALARAMLAKEEEV